MNLNFLQTILTVLSAVSLAGSTILIAFGCSVTDAAVDCSMTTAPAWLVPYLMVGAAVLQVVKLVVKTFQGPGAFTAPTIALPKFVEFNDGDENTRL